MKDAWKTEKWWRDYSIPEVDALMASAWDDGYHESPDFWGSDDDAFIGAFIAWPKLRSLADALADAVEALVANRAWESTSAPEWKTLGDALKAYREVTK